MKSRRPVNSDVRPFLMHMKKSFLLLAIFASTFLADGEARAQCSCVPEYRDITAQKEFTLAHAVFVGKVVAITKSARDEKGNYIETVSFQVAKAWKHDLPSDLTITNHIQGCMNGFEQNEEWLVYAYKHADGTLGTYCCCSRTTLLGKAADDLKAFSNEQPAKIIASKASKP